MKRIEQDLKKIFKNFSLISISQGINILFPIILTPYFIKVFDTTNFAIFVLCQTICTNFNVILEYDYSTRALRDVIQLRDNKAEINHYFSNVFFSKVLVLGIISIIYIIIPFLIPSLKEHLTTYFFSFFLVMGYFTQFQWFFQGLEKLSYFTFFNIISKVVYILLVLVTVKNKHDYYLPNFLNGIIMIITNGISFVLISRKCKLNFIFINTSQILSYLSEGFKFFFSNFLVNLYKNINLIFIAIIFSPTVLSNYAVAEKIVYLFRVVVSIFGQVSYPYLAQFYKLHGKFKFYLNRIYLPFIILLLVTMLFVYFYSDYIVFWFLKGKGGFSEVKNYLYVLLLLPLITSLNIPFYQVLLVNNFLKLCSKILLIGGISALALTIVLSITWGVYGNVMAMYFTEFFYVIIFFVYAFKKKLIRP